MHVLITGAGGFIGSALASRLARAGTLGQQSLSRLSLVDLGFGQDALEGGIVRRHVGDLCNPSWLDDVLGDAPLHTVFHLASVPGGAAERDPELSRRVNLEATLQLLDRLRLQGHAPRLVFASTIAVYGEALPDRIDESTAAVPAMTYGAHKLAAEILISDAVRRGWVQACTLRLPGVVARPGDGTGLVSAFMSRLFWALRAGESIELPVSADGTAWWISAQACVDNLLHAAEIDPQRLDGRCVVQMPALHLSLREVVDALAQEYGMDRHALVRYAPLPQVQRLFAAYPPLDTPRAQALGFRHDGSARELARRAVLR